MALDVAGQNIANVNTPGYTRQRADMTSIAGTVVPSMFSTNDGVGNGVQITGISRLGDLFLDTRVRTETAGASFLSARASAYTTLEAGLGEPGETGLANQLSDMWNAWQDLANTPDKTSAGAVVLENSRAVADRIATLYSNVRTQWDQSRASTVALVAEANAAAANVADLNARILQIQNSGGSANELMDQRDLLVTQLSSLVGASASYREDGQVDVLVGGNALVSGARSHALAVQGATSFAAATGDADAVPPVPGQSVTVVWAENPGLGAGLDGGEVAGLLTVLAPPDGTGNGGALTEAAASLDDLATALATQVNALHNGARTVPVPPATVGDLGGDFFSFDAGQPPALGLRVAIETPADIAVAADGAGALDGSVAKAIGDLGKAAGSPDSLWSKTVVDIGSRTASLTARAKVAEVARAAAESQQLAQASVNEDEETINMLAFQRGYEAASRVLTSIDEMLDTLINRTGIVGR